MHKIVGKKGSTLYIREKAIDVILVDEQQAIINLRSGLRIALWRQCEGVEELIEALDDVVPVKQEEIPF